MNTTIKSLWCYPVKSLLGESLESAVVTERGMDGDRLYALYDPNGKLASGKDTRRFKRIDGLFSLSAQRSENKITISFPDGSQVTNQDADLNSKLSSFLSHTVTLTAESDVSHLDDGPIHIITTSSLAKLHKLIPDSEVNERRFRPNIVLDSGQDILDEDLLGKTLTSGDVQLKIFSKTRRCRMTTLPQSGLKNSPEILKTVSKNFGLDFGVYASVLVPGHIRKGQTVEIVDSA